jgi:hypothetical protein
VPVSVMIQFWAWAAILRPLKHVFSFRWLVRVVQSRASMRLDAMRMSEIVKYLSAIDRFPRRPPANCYERSLAAYRLLAKAGARPELRIGVRRPAAGRLDGHVWVLLDGQPVAETSAFIDQFTPILRVDADGHFEPLGSHPEPSTDRRWTGVHSEPPSR